MRPEYVVTDRLCSRLVARSGCRCVAAAAIWLAVQKSEKALLAPSAVAAEVAIIMPEVPPELSTPSPLPQLMLGVLPAWSNNVELARTQTQEAIDNLTQRFVGIHQRLGGAVSLAAGGKNGDVLLVIQNAAQQLGGVATALEEVLATRDALLTKIETLGQFNDEIRELANRAAQLTGLKTVPDLLTAQQSEGEAAEQTAAQAADIGRQIAAKTKIVKQQIQTALVAANQLNSDAGRMIDNSRAVIAHVIADFRQSALKLSGTVGQLEEENREVDQEVCDILVNLQFQDRISQIIGSCPQRYSETGHRHRNQCRLARAPAMDGCAGTNLYHAGTTAGSWRPTGRQRAAFTS